MTYRVIYRTGGTAAWAWHEALVSLSYEEAEETADAVRRGGRRAFIATEAEFRTLGLPATYEADEYFPPAEARMLSRWAEEA
jgi:hypothetical protein